jgi:alkaline phosphatase D
LNHIVTNKINNTLMLSGDSHVNWAFDIALDNQTGYDPVTGKGAYGVEFAGTAVSSPSPLGANATYDFHKNITDYIVQNNKELQYVLSFPL